MRRNVGSRLSGHATPAGSGLDPYRVTSAFTYRLHITLMPAERAVWP